jgi:hypothetical protein
MKTNKRQTNDKINSKEQVLQKWVRGTGTMSHQIFTIYSLRRGSSQGVFHPGWNNVPIPLTHE